MVPGVEVDAVGVQDTGRGSSFLLLRMGGNYLN